MASKKAGTPWTKEQRAKFIKTMAAKRAAEKASVSVPKYRKKKRKLSLREIEDGVYILIVKD